jgi:hypothetical protein
MKLDFMFGIYGIGKNMPICAGASGFGYQLEKQGFLMFMCRDHRQQNCEHGEMFLKRMWFVSHIPQLLIVF